MEPGSRSIEAIVDFTFGSINEPIVISGATIRREDWIVADESGVVCIPGAHVEAVIEVATRIAEQERELTRKVVTKTVESWDEL